MGGWKRIWQFLLCAKTVPGMMQRPKTGPSMMPKQVQAWVDRNMQNREDQNNMNSFPSSQPSRRIYDLIHNQKKKPLQQVNIPLAIDEPVQEQVEERKPREKPNLQLPDSNFKFSSSKDQKQVEETKSQELENRFETNHNKIDTSKYKKSISEEANVLIVLGGQVGLESRQPSLMLDEENKSNIAQTDADELQDEPRTTQSIIFSKFAKFRQTWSSSSQRSSSLLGSHSKEYLPTSRAKLDSTESDRKKSSRNRQNFLFKFNSARSVDVTKNEVDFKRESQKTSQDDADWVSVSVHRLQEQEENSGRDVEKSDCISDLKNPFADPVLRPPSEEDGNKRTKVGQVPVSQRTQIRTEKHDANLDNVLTENTDVVSEINNKSSQPKKKTTKDLISKFKFPNLKNPESQKFDRKYEVDSYIEKDH